MRRTLLLFSCLCYGLACATVTSAQTLEGRIWDAQSDRVLAHAVVRLVDSEGEMRSVTAADSAGYYRIPVPGAGRYRVQAEHIGYRPYEGTLLELSEPGEVRSVVIEMQPQPLPIRGIEVSADQVDRRIRSFLGVNVSQLRVSAVRSGTIERHAARGYDLSELIRSLGVPNLQVLRTREGPCYQVRGRGCLPVFLDGVRLSRSYPGGLPLDMLGAVVVVLPSELIAYPQGAVHVFTVGFVR